MLPLKVPDLSGLPAAERAQEAARLLDKEHAIVEQARLDRDAAMMHLVRNERWAPVKAYTLASLSRRLYGTAAAARPTADAVNNAVEQARREGERFWRHKHRETALRKMRKQAVIDMLREGRSLAEIARIAGVTPVRVGAIAEEIGLKNSTVA